MYSYLKATFTFLLLTIASNLNAQVSYSAFENQSDLNVKSEMGLELWNYYSRFNLDSLKIAAVDLLLDASSEEHEFARAVGTRMLGSYLWQSGKVDQGLGYLVASCEYFEKKEDFMIASEILNEIGHSHFVNGNQDEAKEAYKKSLRLGEQSPDATAAFNGKLGLAKSYIVTGDTNVGMSLLHSYKQLSIQNQKYEAASDAFAYMAMIESDRGNDNLSVEYYTRSISYSKRSKSKVHIAHSYANMGILKFTLEEYDSSLHYFKKSLELRLEQKSIRPILEGYYNLGFFYMERDSTLLAIQNFNKSIELAKKNEHYSDEIDALNELIVIYNEMDNTDLVGEYTVRIEKLERLIDAKSSSEDKEIKRIDLEFEGKEKVLSTESGVGWITFSLIVVGATLLFLLFLERRRLS